MNMQKTYLACTVVLVASAAVEFAGVHLHAPHWWPFPFGYNIAFGFVGGWILIILSKMIMARALQRKEGYYEGRGENDDE